MPDKFYNLAMDQDARINTSGKPTRGYSACLHYGYRGLPSVTTEDSAVLVSCPICTQPRCQECVNHYADTCPIQ